MTGRAAALENGCRWFPNESFSFDLALFYSDYDMLPDSDIAPDDPLTAALNSNIEGYSYGAEIAEIERGVHLKAAWRF